MEKNSWKKISYWAKKLKAVNLLGGKCEMCGDSNIFHLSFHHERNKNFEVSQTFSDKKWTIIENEIKNCRLMCHNCHNEFHFNKNKDERCYNTKKLYLEYKNVYGCELCGYNKCNSSLHFHHLEKISKIFKICNFNKNFKTIDEITKDIIIEMNKCQIICANCHQSLHSDIDFFNLNYDKILEKSKKLREIQPKLDRNLIKKMYFEDNMKQIEIAKYFKASKGTICDIIKNLKKDLEN